MICIEFDRTFAGWREKARNLLSADVPAGDIVWGGDSAALFCDAIPAGTARRLTVPKPFLDVAELVALHRDDHRWSVMYRVLFRLTHGESHLLEVQSDEDVRELFNMKKSVTHDMHQMKAFVRFREHDGRYVAWYEPDHFIVEALAPWFARRFAAMEWSILTPDRCAHWDTRLLTFSGGVGRSAAPAGDSLEDLWRAYYASTFNPSRTNVDLLRQHMPERRWQTLPEAELIRGLARESTARSQAMISRQVMSAAPFIPEGGSLPVLRDAVA